MDPLTAQHAVSVVDAMSLVGLIVSVIGGALGAFSILVTWKLYQAGSHINVETLKLLTEVKTSSHTTEITSTRYTERLVDALIDMVGKDMQSNLAVSRAEVAKKIDQSLTKDLAGVSPELTATVKDNILAALSTTFRSLEYQTAQVSRLKEPASTASTFQSGYKKMVAPAVPRVIRWIVENESKYKFISVRYLREKVFEADPAAQEALQFCIDTGVVELYEEPNPKKPRFPTTACRLNRDHPLVAEALAEGTQS